MGGGVTYTDIKAFAKEISIYAPRNKTWQKDMEKEVLQGFLEQTWVRFNTIQ